MSLKISDSKSFKLEPLTKNRFIFQFSDIPGSSDQSEVLAFVTHTCSAPSISFEPQQVNRLNETFNFAGKPQWSDLPCTFYDNIRNSSTTELSAGDIVYNWSCMIYNPLTGQMGYKTQYATSATLAQLDPAGNVIRAWNIFGIFPTNVQFGEGLSYSDAGINEVSVTFKYDLAIKIEDSKTSSESA